MLVLIMQLPLSPSSGTEWLPKVSFHHHYCECLVCLECYLHL